MNSLIFAVSDLSLSGNGLVNLLVGLLILALVVWVVFYILGMLPLPEPAKKIAGIIIAVIFLILLLNRVGVSL